MRRQIQYFLRDNHPKPLLRDLAIGVFFIIFLLILALIAYLLNLLIPINYGLMYLALFGMVFGAFQIYMEPQDKYQGFIAIGVGFICFGMGLWFGI